MSKYETLWDEKTRSSVKHWFVASANYTWNGGESKCTTKWGPGGPGGVSGVSSFTRGAVGTGAGGSSVGSDVNSPVPPFVCGHRSWEGFHGRHGSRWCFWEGKGSSLLISPSRGLRGASCSTRPRRQWDILPYVTTWKCKGFFCSTITTVKSWQVTKITPLTNTNFTMKNLPLIFHNYYVFLNPQLNKKNVTKVSTF